MRQETEAKGMMLKRDVCTRVHMWVRMCVSVHVWCVCGLEVHIAYFILCPDNRNPHFGEGS